MKFLQVASVAVAAASLTACGGASNEDNAAGTENVSLESENLDLNAEDLNAVSIDANTVTVNDVTAANEADANAAGNATNAQ